VLIAPWGLYNTGDPGVDHFARIDAPAETSRRVLDFLSS
jgi:hypothetical protein